jgi:hypothetical protein
MRKFTLLERGSVKIYRIILGTLCVATMALAQNLVQNPGFETGAFPPWIQQGWTIGNGALAHGGADYANTGCVGPACIAPAPGGGAWLYQDLITVPGMTYTLTFYYFPGPSTGGEELQVLWGATSTPLTSGGPATCTGSCVFDNTSSNTSAYMQYTVTHLMATSTSSRLEFLGRQDPSYDGLDDVVVQLSNPNPSTTPAPPSVLLLMIGLAGLVFYAGYHRRVQGPRRI